MKDWASSQPVSKQVRGREWGAMEDMAECKGWMKLWIYCRVLTMCINLSLNEGAGAGGGHWEPLEGFWVVYTLCVPMLASEDLVITR